MSKRPMPPRGGDNLEKRKNPPQSVNQLPTQVAARDIPIYLRKQPLLDPEAFVYVEVAIVWPDSGRVSLVDVRMTEAKINPARFSAFFTGDCAGFLHSVKSRDKICLYLSEATMHEEEQCKQNTLNLPFALTYDKRCRLRSVEKGMVGSSITFPTPKEKRATSAKTKRRPLARKETTSSVPEETPPQLSPAPLGSATEIPHRPDTAPAEIWSLPGDRYPTPQPEAGRRTKWRSRKRRKSRPQQEDREASKLQQPSDPTPENVDQATEPDDVVVVSSKIPGDSPNSPKGEIIDLTIKEESPPMTPIAPVQVPGQNEGAPSLKAGCGSFLPLSAISRSTDIRKLYSTIGVVTNARAVTETRTKELSQRIHLSDPSYPSAEDPAANPMGHGITMFAKRYREWLPSPKEGDILILRGIKQVKNHQFGDHGSVIFGDKLKWAIYDPVSESVTHGDLGDAPRESGADDGRGTVIKPFYEPEPGDLLYCKRLSEWWKTTEKKRAEGHDPAVQCVNLSTRRMSHRVHRLICDTDHESEPGGYFDCTVQVLQGFKNDNGVYSLYVTDFTKNKGLLITDKWPGRKDMVLKIEMWDAAASRGPSLKNRGYYLLENCRMLDQEGYLQGKIVEPKIRELSKEDEKDMADSRFAELLRREGEFEKGNDLPMMLENAPDESFFTCIVELLDRTSDGSDIFLHVTDYTLVPEIFKSAFSQEPKFEHLRGRVVKLRVRGPLVERASSMPMVNSYYRLEKLRFWQTGETWACDIKGNNGKIEKLNPANAEHNGMVEIKRRKKELGSSVTGSGTASRARSLMTDPGGRQLDVTTGRPTGGQMGPPTVSVLPPKEELPTCFEVKAKILDFYPIALDEEDCLLRVCGDCEKLIAKTAESCLSCSSMVHQAPVVFRYSLLFMLGVENGEELVATVGNIDNGLTGGINGQDEDDALHQLKTMLKPLVGNLFKIHGHWLRQEEVDLQVDAPLVNFKLNAWVEEWDGKGDVVRYAVQDVTPL